MKVIELDIDKTKNPKQIYDRLLDEKPEKGDHFKVLTSLDKDSFSVMVAVIIVMMVVYVMVSTRKNIAKATTSFGEEILNKLFGKYNSVEEVKKEIEEEGYQVEIEQKKKGDEKGDEDEILQKGIEKLVSNSKTFSYLKDDEDLYTVNDLKEKYK